MEVIVKHIAIAGLILVVSAFCPILHDVSRSQESSNQSVKVTVAGIEGAIFSEVYTAGWLPNGIFGLVNPAGSWTPAVGDIEHIERGLKTYLEAAKVDTRLADPIYDKSNLASKDVSRRIGQILHHYERFRRQYFGLMVKGSKKIYVNCFLDSCVVDDHGYPNWEENLLIELDGGFTYWQVVYDLETSQFSNLFINGDA